VRFWSPSSAAYASQQEANCRQILRRARQHLTHHRPRFDPSPQQREKLLHEFLEASRRGDMHGLEALLSDDVVLYADGGGKGTAVPRPIAGADNVARFIFGARRKRVPANVIRHPAQINGQPGVVAYVDGQPYSVLSIDVADGRIRSIYIVTNPDKLGRLPRLEG
jgi:RNA polymerase sigma-70 factor (ECF subfamily)